METCLHKVLPMRCTIYVESTCPHLSGAKMEAAWHSPPNWRVEMLITDWPKNMNENLLCVKIHGQCLAVMPVKSVGLINFFKFIIVSPPQSSLILSNSVTFWFVIISLLFFYLKQALFSSFLRLEGDFKHHITWQWYIQCDISLTHKKSSFSKDSFIYKISWFAPLQPQIYKIRVKFRLRICNCWPELTISFLF